MYWNGPAATPKKVSERTRAAVTNRCRRSTCQPDTRPQASIPEASATAMAEHRPSAVVLRPVLPGSASRSPSGRRARARACAQKTAIHRCSDSRTRAGLARRRDARDRTERDQNACSADDRDRVRRSQRFSCGQRREQHAHRIARQQKAKQRVDEDIEARERSSARIGGQRLGQIHESVRVIRRGLCLPVRAGARLTGAIEVAAMSLRLPPCVTVLLALRALDDLDQGLREDDCCDEADDSP